MVTTNDFKNGMIIDINGVLCIVVEFLHVKPGKGGAFVRTKLKNLLQGGVVERTFRAGEKIDEVRVEKRKLGYSYFDGQNYVFMDIGTYEQFEIAENLIIDTKNYLIEGLEVMCYFKDESIILVEPPLFVNLKVTETPPGVKGNTVTGATKTAVMETGVVINVPLFINEGDKIKIDTRTKSYVERL